MNMLRAIGRSDPSASGSDPLVDQPAGRPSADGRPIGGCAARQGHGPSADGSDPSVDRWLVNQETWTHSK